jgi:hypothetical protein
MLESTGWRISSISLGDLGQLNAQPGWGLEFYSSGGVMRNLFICVLVLFAGCAPPGFKHEEEKIQESITSVEQQLGVSEVLAKMYAAQPDNMPDSIKSWAVSMLLVNVRALEIANDENKIAMSLLQAMRDYDYVSYDSIDAHLIRAHLAVMRVIEINVLLKRFLDTYKPDSTMNKRQSYEPAVVRV